MCALVLLATASLLVACEDRDKPPLAIEGGGFVFNYRIAEAFYGVSVKPMRRLAAGSVIEATFEDPAGGPPIVVREQIAGQRLAYMLRTPALSGIVKDRPYQVVVRLLPGAGREAIASLSRTFTSDLDQSALPTSPLVVGPGYAPNTTPAAIPPTQQ